MSRATDLAVELLDHLRDPAFERDVLPAPNFWDVIHYGEASYENRYNRMVRWLVDPTGNHGFGADIANALVQAVDPAAPLIGRDGVHVRVETPVPADGAGDSDRKGRIDVTVADTRRRVYVAIESKMRSQQHSEQLLRYRRHVERELAPTDQGWSTVFVFLTEDATAMPDDDSWRHLTYEQFGDLVREVHDTRTEAHASDKIITDFLDDVDRRGRTSDDAWIAGLFFEDAARTQVRYADLILEVLEDQSPDDESLRKDAVAQRIRRVAQPVADPAATTEEIARAFEAAGRPATDAQRVLAHVWLHRPPVQDKSRDPRVQEFYTALAHVLGDGFTLTGSKASQGGNLRWGEQRVWIAGNGKGALVSQVAHVRSTPGGETCRLRTKLIFPAAAAAAGVPRMRSDSAEWTPQLLADTLDAVLRGGGVCTCGTPLVGATVAQG